MTRHNPRHHFSPSTLLGLIAALLLTGCRPDGARNAWYDSAPEVLLSKVNEAHPITPQTNPPVFATYNVHWLEDPAGIRNDLNQLSAVTAWAFQEVRSTDDGISTPSPAALCDVLPPGQWHVAWVALNRLHELNSADFEGQAIASRYPIRSAEVCELESSKSGKRRAALAAVLDVNGTDVLFVNTDHAPGLLSPTPGNEKQTHRLIDHLRRRPDGPAVVAGDFNTAGCIPRLSSARAQCGRLRESMLAAEFHEAGGAGLRTFHAGPYAATLDHVFLRGLTCDAADVDAAASGSDHRPVWCRFKFE